MKFEHCLIFSLSLCSSFRAASNVDLLFWMQVGKFGYLKIYRQFDTQKNVDILIPCWMRSKVDIVWFEWRLIVFEIHPKRKKREKREITLIFQINFLCIDDWGKLWMNVVLVFVYWNIEYVSEIVPFQCWRDSDSWNFGLKTKNMKIFQSRCRSVSYRRFLHSDMRIYVMIFRILSQTRFNLRQLDFSYSEWKVNGAKKK